MAGEVRAAVVAALANVTAHAGTGGRAFVLVEDEGDTVTVTVRDDGVGMAPNRLAEAEAAGRLGVAQSILGRIRDLAGTVTITSRLGAGTEVEMRVPRPRMVKERRDSDHGGRRSSDAEGRAAGESGPAGDLGDGRVRPSRGPRRKVPPGA